MTAYRMAFSTMELDAKLVHGDPRWRSFNASFTNEEVSIQSAAWMIDDGRAFTTWHSNQWRDSDNFICGQHLGVDFDTFGVDTALADSFVAKYAAIVYATPSSTPEAPRCRAVFLLDAPIKQASNYVRAAKALLFIFGGRADKQCKDAARFFYGSLGSMPIVRPLELPLSVVKQNIALAEAAQAKPAPAPSNYTPHTSDAQDAQRLLDRVSPARADDYATWLEVGMALSTLGNDGLSLWDSWSRRSTKYVPGECAAKWRSFDGAGITLATLAHYAKQDSPHAR